FTGGHVAQGADVRGAVRGRDLRDPAEHRGRQGVLRRHQEGHRERGAPARGVQDPVRHPADPRGDGRRGAREAGAAQPSRPARGRHGNSLGPPRLRSLGGAARRGDGRPHGAAAAAHADTVPDLDGGAPHAARGRAAPRTERGAGADGGHPIAAGRPGARPRGGRVMGWLLLVVVVVLGVPAAAYLAQDRLLFLPHLAKPPGAVRPPRPVEEVAFATADGPQVRGWLAPAQPGGPAPLIVYYGGNAED